MMVRGEAGKTRVLGFIDRADYWMPRKNDFGGFSGVGHAFGGHAEHRMVGPCAGTCIAAHTPVEISSSLT